VYGNAVLDYSQAIAVNTNNPAILYPYISDEDPSAVLPYVVLESQVSSVPAKEVVSVVTSAGVLPGFIRQNPCLRGVTGA